MSGGQVQRYKDNFSHKSQSIFNGFLLKPNNCHELFIYPNPYSNRPNYDHYVLQPLYQWMARHKDHNVQI